MKKLIALMIVLAMMLVFVSSCSQNTTSEQTDYTDEFTEKEQNEELKVDLDVTGFSITIVYALLENMVQNPDDYIGKTVKITGNMSTWKDSAGDDVYCLTIWDQTQCCSAEIRIKFDYEKVDKSSIPSPGEDYTVIGIFDSEFDGETYYSYLWNCVIV